MLSLSSAMILEELARQSIQSAAEKLGYPAMKAE